jgi:YD repeat-containing protein
VRQPLGPVAYIKLKIACDTAKSDDTIDQETFFSYDNRGRVTREFIQDDTTRTALTYVFDDNGNMTRVVRPQDRSV